MASRDGDGIVAGIGCMMVLVWLGFWGFVLFLAYKLVMWLTTQSF